MVAMGRALMSRPRLLLMDEPSMGLSPALVQQNFRIIKEVHESGVSVLMVEQNATMALSIADRGYVLSTGQIVLEGPASELLEERGLEARVPGPVSVTVRSRDGAAELDAADPLREYRDRFVIDPDVVYLDGNSLGCLPRATVARLERVVAHWGDRGVRAWDEGWLELPLEVGDRLGAAVLGAAPGQTVIGDSTTVCFYKLVSAALDARPGRTQIVTDAGNFPTDRYVLEGLARARGIEIVWLDGEPHPRRRRRTPRPGHRAGHLLARVLSLGPHRRHG